MLYTGMILTASVAWLISSVSFLAGFSNFKKRKINELVLYFAIFWLVVATLWFLVGLRLWFAWLGQFEIDRIIFIADQIVLFWHFIAVPYFVARQWFPKKISLIISIIFSIGAVFGMVFTLIEGVELKEITFFVSKYAPRTTSWLLFVIMFSLLWLAVLVRILFDLIRKVRKISVSENILLANFSIILYGILGALDESGIFRGWELVFLRLLLIGPPILAYVAFETKLEIKQFQPKVFQKKIGIFWKILFALLLSAVLPFIFGISITVLSYRDFIRDILTNPALYTKDRVLLAERNIETQAALLLLLSIISALFWGILVSRGFSKMINRISQGFKRVMAGDLYSKLPVERSDELGEATYFFNQLVDNLRTTRLSLLTREKELHQKTLELEEKVKQLELAKKEEEKARLATLNILEDIEEARMLAEEEKLKTQLIIYNLTDGLILFDTKLNVAFVNPMTASFFNLKLEKFLGKNISEFYSISGLDKLAEVLVANNAIKKLFKEEVEINQNLILEVSTVFLSQQKKVIGTIAILHDITREKIIERMKTEFVSLAAHQLRTPLSAIKWTLGTLLAGDFGELSPYQKEYVKMAYQSNQQLIDLINDLLNVTRIEEGRFIYKTEPADIEQIVESMVEYYKKEGIEEKKLNLIFVKPKQKLPKVNVDIEKINLAIQNLIDNAIKYSLPGGEIKVSLEKIDQEIKFSVKDKGIGIPKDQQARIFTKFFRAAEAIKMATEGSGLGLYITKNIIEAHKGKIGFESQEGKGSTFWFTLPVKK